MTVKFVLFICLLAVVTGAATTLFLNQTKKQIAQSQMLSEKDILAECTSHTEDHPHYHVQLTITTFGKNFPIPANTGIDNGCMHPLHTHDTSGRLHIDYKRSYPFIIGDFFTVWGMIFNQRQIGNLLTGERYTIQMLVNKKEHNEFEKYILKDGDKIEITVENKK